MREVILTVGPRGCGKSSFCQRAVVLDPSVVLISRDELLIKLFGKTSLSPYTGDHEYVYEQMWKMVEEKLESTSKLRMILDTWNGTSDERYCIIRMLRFLGVDQIKAWYFVTPAENVCEWFWKKPDVAKISEMSTRQGEDLSFYSEDAPLRDHALFHKLAADIDSDGFDGVIKVNPLITQPEQILGLQTSLET
ncbi:MAG: AAA family ATPase [Candidatus Paceibacterota bacterium]|jgi:predicted kinase